MLHLIKINFLKNFNELTPTNNNNWLTTVEFINLITICQISFLEIIRNG